MEIDDQKGSNALYLALRESAGELGLQSTSEQDLYLTAFWLFRRMKKHYDSDSAQPWNHEGHSRGF